MLRKLIGASVALLLSVGIVGADDIRAIIKRVDSDKAAVTFSEYKAKKERGPDRTLKADQAPVYWAKFNWDTMKTERGERVKEGLRHPLFGRIGEGGGEGLAALVITDSENKKVKEIRVFPPNQKK